MELDDEKLSFSKKVVGTVTWLFVGIIMFSAGTWLIYREIPAVSYTHLTLPTTPYV